MRAFSQEGKERPKAELFALDQGLAFARATANVLEHVLAERREQLIEKILPGLEMVVKSALRDARALCDQRNRRFLVAPLADHRRCGAEQPLADHAPALVARGRLTPVGVIGKRGVGQRARGGLANHKNP